MILSRVQKKRFLAGFMDLEILTFMISIEEATKTFRPAAKKFRMEIVETLKKSPMEEYVRFDLDGDVLQLVLKVDKLGKIVGYVSLNYKEKGLADPSKVKTHARLNLFVESSSLRDPAIEYVGD